MTVRAWLRERTPRPPERLTERIDTALGDRGDADRIHAEVACLDAADLLLREILIRESTGRESALDLLTVDALVTYAFEAASERPDSLESHAAHAIVQLSSAVSDE
jgi:hypothetical protein